MEGDLYTHAGAVFGGAVAAGAAVWGFMRRLVRGAAATSADSQALREVRAVDKKHSDRIDGLERRVSAVEQNTASVSGELRQMNKRLDDIWSLLSKGSR